MSGIDPAKLYDAAAGVWEAFIPPGTLAVVGIAWKIYSEWRKGRTDERSEEEKQRLALAELNAKERLQLSTEMKEWLERQALRIKEQDAELETMRIKNARLTLWWEECRAAVSDAQQKCNAAERSAGGKITQWPRWSWEVS